MSALHSGLERTLDEDVADGFRMLVGMGERSLSDSAFLDHITALHASTASTTGFVSSPVARRTATSTTRRATCGVTVPAMTWEAYVHLAFDELRFAGVRSPQVDRRLVAALDDPLEVAPDERRGVLADQLRLLTTAIRDDSDRDGVDRQMATEPDSQGIGVLAGRLSPSPGTPGHRREGRVPATSR